MAVIRPSYLASLDKIEDNGHWRFGCQLDYIKAFGFVYLIRMNSTGLKYIGRKNFRTQSKYKSKNGFQTNWRSYTSSSKDLNTLIDANGKQDFSFFVLEQYYTSGAVGYAETWSQMVAETPSNQDKWLNRMIEKVCWKSTEPISERHKKRLEWLIKN